MGAQASHDVFNDAQSSDVIELFFLRVGTSREVKPAERLIREGEAISTVYLIMEGELLLKKKGAANAHSILPSFLRDGLAKLTSKKKATLLIEAS